VIEGGLLAYAAYDTGKTAVDVKADLDAGRLDAAASKVGGLTGTIIGGVGASKVLGKGVTRAAGEVVGQGKVLLAAEDCNAAGLKRLFEPLPKKAGNGRIAYLKTEAEISEVWTQLEKTGAAVIEFEPGKFRMQLADGTHIIKYGSSTDETITLSFNGKDFESALKIHLQTK
jgi:hypothetical protein